MNYIKFKRVIDIQMALIISILILPVIFLIIFLLICQSGFPIIHWSKRIGKRNNIFYMPKFRTMKIDTPEIATHLIRNPEQYTTKLGGFLRKTSLDELPQILSVIQGKMSFIGPRPALYNQYDLIKLRTEKQIDKLAPGITGWAQINGRDELSIKAKVKFDEYYLNNVSFYLDLKILLKSLKVFYKDSKISH